MTCDLPDKIDAIGSWIDEKKPIKSDTSIVNISMSAKPGRRADIFFQ
ncbi:hypothetical protein ACFS07_02560 [Undibacterium arcticum]